MFGRMASWTLMVLGTVVVFWPVVAPLWPTVAESARGMFKLPPTQDEAITEPHTVYLIQPVSPTEAALMQVEAVVGEPGSGGYVVDDAFRAHVASLRYSIAKLEADHRRQIDRLRQENKERLEKIGNHQANQTTHAVVGVAIVLLKDVIVAFISNVVFVPWRNTRARARRRAVTPVVNVKRPADDS